MMESLGAKERKGRNNGNKYMNKSIIFKKHRRTFLAKFIKSLSLTDITKQTDWEGGARWRL